MLSFHRLAAALLLVSSVITPALQATPVEAAPGTRQIPSSGTVHLVSTPAAADLSGVQAPEFAPDVDSAHDDNQGSAVGLRRGAGPAGGGTVAPGPNVASSHVVQAAAKVTTSFTGLNLRQQRLANGGNQFTVEPPDQGLCIGHGFVIESVNDVIQVFDTAGTPLSGVVDLNSFYGYPAQFNRTTGLQGPFVTDPTCWFDPDTQRFYHVVLTLEVFPDTGDFTGVNHLDLAVSVSNDPFDGFNRYRIDVTDDGTDALGTGTLTPNHGCPPGGPPRPGHHAPTHPNACIGDFPHIGADNNGIYLTTNEYCLFCAGIGFHAAQVYAFNKDALAAGAASVPVTQIDTHGMQDGKPGFTLWPATSPTVGDFDLFAGGTEWFTSSNAAEEVSGVPNSAGHNHSDQIVVWGLSNTKSLRSATPDIRLHNATVTVDNYTVPPPSNQKVGPAPLKDCLNDTTLPTPFGMGCWSAILVNEPKHNEVEGPLDSSDSRVLSTTFTRGFLWGTLDTGVDVGGATKAGVLFYIISPRIGNEGAVSTFLVRQGHIAVANNNVIYGTVAATHTGRAVVGFTLAGADHFPSAAYVSLNSPASAADVKVIAEGLGPQDGFTEYNSLSNTGVARPRWGDYGASVATGDNTIWLANEWIAQTCTLAQYMSAPFGSCGGTRVTLGNWATRVTELDVSP